MPPFRVAGLVVAAALVTAVLAACSGSDGGQASGSGTASTAAKGARVATVTITAAKGCELDRTDFAAGGITFKIQNKDATAVSEVELLAGERILGEKENVAAGLGGEFAVKVDAGTYTVYCPGAATEKRAITVTGTAAAVDNSLAGLLKAGTDGYKRYVDTQVGYLLADAKKLDTALHGTDLVAAQDAYIAARPFYEKIEPVAESFVNGTQNLDADIDARANDVPAAQWSGFHRIEKGLFQDNSVNGLGRWGDKLVTDITTLQTKTRRLIYQAPDLANGAQGLLDEVASGKITGEEERYSHIDIVDMANNVEGSEQAFAQIEPAVQKIDPNLAATITAQFSALDKVIDKYRTTSNVSGYMLYTSLADADRRNLAAAVKAVQEPLSRVAAKVANA
jgi:iron uptake system component EfeO